MGLITLDPDRKIDACLGSLVDWFSTGGHASDALPFLAGLDDVLDEIANGQRPSLALPRVAIQEGQLADRVLSLEIMSSETSDGLQVLVRDETELASLEQNVLQQRNELALANEALSEARQRAEAALREKASFLANISHDLKTPLQVIMGNAEILRGELPEDEREAFLQDVLDNSNFLLALITDLLDASALEAEQLRLTEEVVDIRALLERILSMASQMPNGDARRFELTVDDGHRAIKADPMRLRRLLFNVVSNAVKFTGDDGRIAVRAGPAHSGDFMIEVEDDG
ncbi:MAG: ATP-binding protein, partial [Alphaproteobacteria bacterium]|nr:ATP-binding protein [Alphaproteobacteria bacterium]